MAKLIARSIGLAFVALACGAAWGLLAHWGEPALRSIARGVFALALLDLGRLAWTWPTKQPQRFRERTTRLLAVMATPSLHEDYAESSPQVSLPVAFLDDWDLLARQRRGLSAGTLTPEETSVLDDLGRVLEHLRPSLLSLGMIPASELSGHEAWRLLVSAAERARRAWISRPTA